MIGNDCFGYEIEDKSYDIYYNKEAYNKFISKMQNGKYNKFYNQYNHGKGSELKEKEICHQRWQVWLHLQDFVIWL